MMQTFKTARVYFENFARSSDRIKPRCRGIRSEQAPANYLIVDSVEKRREPFEAIDSLSNTPISVLQLSSCEDCNPSDILTMDVISDFLLS